MVSLIHLLSLLSAAFLAGLVSSTAEARYHTIRYHTIPLEQSAWTVNGEFFIDDGFLESGKDIVYAKSLIEGMKKHLKNGMEPSLLLNTTGLHYLRGYQTM